MTAYLGPAGNLVAFKCPSDEQIGLADSVSLSRTLGGVQKAQYGRRAPRAWQVGIGTATPAELGQLMGLLQGMYGPPPWTYVGPWAQVTNLLSPTASALQPGTWVGTASVSGPQLLDDGTRSGGSLVADTERFIGLQEVPVVPGVPVSASIWAAGQSGFTISMAFKDAAGAQISNTNTVVAAPLGFPLVRGGASLTPPLGATTFAFGVFNAMRFTQPAVTWTPEVAEWSVGQGAPKVIAHGLAEAVQLAVRDISTLRRSAMSFTISEVGNA